MSRAFKCRDTGLECSFEATGETVDDVMKKATAHAKSTHGQQQISPEVQNRMRAAIRDVSSAGAGAGASAGSRLP